MNPGERTAERARRRAAGPAAHQRPQVRGAVLSGSARDQTLLTLFVMAYNQDRFVREAVESALAQTSSNLEIILSDDASTRLPHG